MILTFEARLPSSDQDGALDTMGVWYGRLKHKLYAQIAKNGGSAKNYKVEFSKEHKITARQFNAIAIDLQGSLDSVTELLKTNLKDAQRKLLNTRLRIRQTHKKFQAIKAGTLELTPEALAKLKRKQFWLKRDVEKLTHKIAGFKKRLSAKVPGITFGTKALFKKQNTLAVSGYASRKEWQKDWKSSRNHQFFFVGSKDETGGNRSCTLFVVDDKLTLRIRMPDGMRSDKYLTVPVPFTYGREQLLNAFNTGTALTWRFHRDERGWRVFVSLDVPASKRVSKVRKLGVLGIDFNADHLAVALTSPDGNFLKAWRFELPVEGKKTGHRFSLLSDALGEIIALALKYNVPVAIEDLDFSKKKKELANKSAGYSRMISGLMYSKYQQLMATKCNKAGIELIKVNPAYTSVIGRAKYAKSLGISVHQSAAFVIGRRAQGFRERVPATLKFIVENRVETLHLPVRTDATGPLTNWALVGKSLMESLHKARVSLKLSLRAHRKGQWCGEEPPPRRSSSSPPTQRTCFSVEEPQF